MVCSLVLKVSGIPLVDFFKLGNDIAAAEGFQKLTENPVRIRVPSFRVLVLADFKLGDGFFLCHNGVFFLFT